MTNVWWLTNLYRNVQPLVIIAPNSYFAIML